MEVARVGHACWKFQFAEEPVCGAGAEFCVDMEVGLQEGLERWEMKFW